MPKPPRRTLASRKSATATSPSAATAICGGRGARWRSTASRCGCAREREGVREMDDAAPAQGARISPEALLVAMSDGRSWLMNVGSSDLTALPVSAVAAEHATLAASLVEGAISAGLGGAAPPGGARSPPLLRYTRRPRGHHACAGPA